jgi:accessory gene regulator protein AgrB
MIFGKRSPTSKPNVSQDERKRRKREAVLSLVIILAVAVLTLAENRVITFGADIPVSNTILMFILININLLLSDSVDLSRVSKPGETALCPTQESHGRPV